jgi:alginate O-acetyltransferase complex protein AlgI
MVFQSWQFFLFLLGLFLGQLFFKPTAKWVLLLIASLFFYLVASKWAIFLLIFTIIWTFKMGSVLANEKVQKVRYRYLLFSCLVQVLILGAFKYLGFFNECIAEIAHWSNQSNYFQWPSLIMPLGISFFTFQSMGYVFDVYYNIRKPETHLGHYALFVSFFPQIQSGPIGRSKEMLPQWKEIKLPKWEIIRMALVLFLWGLVKKFVIADRLGIYVDEVYLNASLHGTAVWIFILFLYTFQLYTDFSAYSDMAMASAKCLGIEISENFMYPYKANNITDFWRRWHLSLSNWLRDYIYTPLLFSKKKWKKGAVVYAIAITFFICGIWHGPKMTFVYFGILQATLLIYEMQSKSLRESVSKRMNGRVYQALSVVLTFFVISLCFIFFRADDLHQVGIIFQQLFHLNFIQDLAYFKTKNISAILGLILLLILFIKWDQSIAEQIRNRESTGFRMMMITAILLVILMLGMVLGKEQFIYFQF